MKRPLLKGQQSAVSRARSLWVNHHVQSLLQNRGCCIDALDRSFAVAAIDRHEIGQPHACAQDRHAKELLLHQHRTASRNAWDEHGRIEVGDMVRHEDVVLPWLQILQAAKHDLHSDQANAEDGQRERHTW